MLNRRHRLTHLFSVAALALTVCLIVPDRMKPVATGVFAQGSNGIAEASRVAVHAAGRGNPWIKLGDGIDLQVDYSAATSFKQLSDQGQTRPLALASADFDEDGVPDLITGYAAANGGGVTLLLGNVDSIYPNAPDAKARKQAGTFTSSPFLTTARAFDVPVTADFVAAGDFDADGHWDVVAASREDSGLYFFTGDGRGSFGAPERIEVSGRVTAMAAGEVNRADGLTDLVVGTVNSSAAKVLVLESPEGARRAKPEAFEVQSEASGIAVGNIDDEYTMDIAVTSGNELLVVWGRDRRLSSDMGQQATVGEARTNRRAFPFGLKGVAMGDFKGDQKVGLSVLTSEGSIHLLSPSEKKAKKKKKAGLDNWKDELLAAGSWEHATGIVRVRISAIPSDDLVVIDPESRNFGIVVSAAAAELKGANAGPVGLEAEGAPVAVLPMRLNADALSDLVVLTSDRAEPAVLMTGSGGALNAGGEVGQADFSPAAVFTVTNTNDSGAGSLRQAILDANGNAGLDTITFSIGLGPQTISPLSSLPGVTDPVVIDGTTQPGFAGTPIIEIDGTNAGMTGGIGIGAGNSTVRGLVMNRYQNVPNLSGQLLVLTTAGNNIIEGNFLGTNIAGTGIPGPRVRTGVLVFTGSGNNTIGGLVPAARNVISGCGFLGVQINSGTGGDVVIGNFFGTDLTGTFPIANATGVAVQNSLNVSIGSTAPGARNVISASDSIGVLANSTGTQVQGNFIGTSITGASPIGNVTAGILIVGTGIAVNDNVIAFNGTGVRVQGGSGNSILSNSIFANAGFPAGLGIDLAGNGVTANDSCDTDSGPNNLQNSPVLTAAFTSGSRFTILGTLNSTANSTFTIQFFSNSACNPSGFGEGETLIGSTTVTTDASCNGAFTLITGVPPGQFITATATDGSGNTSEFSNCIPITSSSADLALTKTASPAAPKPGDKLTYTITVTNNGPTSATNVVVADSLPSAVTFVSCTATGGGVCSGTGNGRTVTFAQLSLNSSATITFETTVNASVPNGTKVDNTATVTALSIDPLPANNTATVSVTVSTNPIALTCPVDVRRDAAQGQSSAVVSYTTPASPAGVTVTCAPPSGSTFPVGTTTVNCTATDAAGNRGACSFIVTVGPFVPNNPSADKTSIDFGPAIALPNPNPPSGTFTISNTGAAAVDVTLGSIRRTGGDVANGKITNPDDSGFFTVFVINANGSETALSIGSSVSIPAGQRSFRVAFTPTIPAVATRTSNLAANQVLPDVVASSVNFTTSDGRTLTISLTGRVATTVRLIDPANTTRPPVVTFSRSGNQFTLTYSVFDSNLDVNRASYQFLDSGGQPVGEALEVNLAQALQPLGLARAQSFTVEQPFSGASSHPEVNGVRVTVFDGETNASGSATIGQQSTSSLAAGESSDGVKLRMPKVKLRRLVP